MSFQPLMKNDLILIAPSARFVLVEEMNEVKNFLINSGFRVEFSPGLFLRFHQFAGNDEERAKSMQWALDHPEAKAILMARGGYGSVRVIDKLLFNQFFLYPKLLMGFSDITVLHAALNNKGIVTLHSPLASTLLKDASSAEKLLNSLLCESYEMVVPAHPKNKVGKVNGKIVGGNLSVLFSLSGSVHDLNTEGKILFLEDVDEYLYHIDRMMQWLHRSGKLKKIKALLVGGFSSMKDHEIPFGWNAEEIISEIADYYDFPVAFGLPCGHDEQNYPLFFNRECDLEITKEKTIIKFL
ncbi:MAG: LD-carboxypeptidase [Bacteroidia bacterium]|nr:LD-carboxypeptidase [Bacteroidia bacterium]